jgi:flagellar hook-associated protein 3 FlgL
MRVTQKMMTTNFTSYIHRQGEALLKIQQKIASQKRINTISDDPIGMSQVLKYRTKLEVINQYEENITQGITRLEVNEQILELATDLVGIAKEVAEGHLGSNITAEEKRLAAIQIKDLYDQIMQIANSKFGDNYIFSGHATDTAPFSRLSDYSPENYHGDDGTVRIMVAENVDIDVDADGRNLFMASGGVNIFQELKNLIDGLENPDPILGSAQIEATIDPLYNAREQINNIRAEYGPIFYRLQATEEYWSNLKPKIQDALAGTEEADIPRAIVELQNLELAYETTLATAARIIQPSLMDFLR